MPNDASAFDIDDVHVDLSDVQLWDPDEYDLLIEAIEPRLSGPNSKVPGSKMANFTLVNVTPGSKFVGRKIFQLMNLGGKGAFLISQLLVSQGLANPGEDHPIVKLSSLLDRTVKAYVKIDDGDDEHPARNVVGRFV